MWHFLEAGAYFLGPLRPLSEKKSFTPGAWVEAQHSPARILVLVAALGHEVREGGYVEKEGAWESVRSVRHAGR